MRRLRDSPGDSRRCGGWAVIENGASATQHCKRSGGCGAFFVRGRAGKKKKTKRDGERVCVVSAGSTKKGCGRSFFCVRANKRKTREEEGAQIYFVIFHLSIQPSENHLPFRFRRPAIETVVLPSNLPSAAPPCFCVF